MDQEELQPHGAETMHTLAELQQRRGILEQQWVDLGIELMKNPSLDEIKNILTQLETLEQNIPPLQQYIGTAIVQTRTKLQGADQDTEEALGEQIQELESLRRGLRDFLNEVREKIVFLADHLGDIEDPPEINIPTGEHLRYTREAASRVARGLKPPRRSQSKLARIPLTSSSQEGT